MFSDIFKLWQLRHFRKPHLHPIARLLDKRRRPPEDREDLECQSLVSRRYFPTKANPPQWDATKLKRPYRFRRSKDGEAAPGNSGAKKLPRALPAEPPILIRPSLRRKVGEAPFSGWPDGMAPQKNQLASGEESCQHPATCGGQF